jgi:hypothetical protein
MSPQPESVKNNKQTTSLIKFAIFDDLLAIHDGMKDFPF